jgi:hypothetical protein
LRTGTDDGGAHHRPASQVKTAVLEDLVDTSEQLRFELVMLNETV